MAQPLLILAVVLAAFVPPIIYLIWVRDQETCRREPYSALLVVFGWGATVAVGASFIFEEILMVILYSAGSPLARGFWNFQPFDQTLQTVILAVIIAPVVEETMKATGVFLASRCIVEVEDGLVYGAASGLGFAAVENVLYLIIALSQGLDAFVVTAAVRAVTSTVLHGSSSAIAGYGISRWKFFRQSKQKRRWLPYLLVAMLLHAAFNTFAILGDVISVNSDLWALIGLLLAFVLATTAFAIIRKTIRDLDRSVRCPPFYKYP